MPETGWTVPFDLSRVGEKGCAASTCTAGFGNPAGSAAHCLLVLQALALTASALVCLLVPRGSGSFLLLAQRPFGQGGLWQSSPPRHLLTCMINGVIYLTRKWIMMPDLSASASGLWHVMNHVPGNLVTKQLVMRSGHSM